MKKQLVCGLAAWSLWLSASAVAQPVQISNADLDKVSAGASLESSSVSINGSNSGSTSGSPSALATTANTNTPSHHRTIDLIELFHDYLAGMTLLAADWRPPV
jgi:hypothetical protein